MRQHALRAVTLTDLAAVRAMNDASVPHVNRVSDDFLRSRLNDAQYFTLCIDESDMPCGFVLAFGPGVPYASPNYQWFCRRYASFLYVDRIVVVQEARGRGVGAALYEGLSAAATPPVRCIVCEVNLRPPNPGSLAFHMRMGFREVGRQVIEGGSKEVILLAKMLARDMGRNG